MLVFFAFCPSFRFKIRHHKKSYNASRLCASDDLCVRLVGNTVNILTQQCGVRPPGREPPYRARLGWLFLKPYWIELMRSLAPKTGNKQVGASFIWATKKKSPALLSMKYWLVNRDPYFMVYEIIPQKINWGPFFSSPKKTTLNNQGALLFIGSASGLFSLALCKKILTSDPDNSAETVAPAVKWRDVGFSPWGPVFL